MKGCCIIFFCLDVFFVVVCCSYWLTVCVCVKEVIKMRCVRYGDVDMLYALCMGVMFLEFVFCCWHWNLLFVACQYCFFSLFGPV